MQIAVRPVIYSLLAFIVATLLMLIPVPYPAAAATLAQTATIPPGWPRLHVEQVVDGLERPIHLTHAQDGSGRIFVVEQEGRIRIIEDGALLDTPFLDIVARVNSSCGECGLLSVAFAPDYAQSGYFFVYYTAIENLVEPTPGDGNEPNGDNDTVVARFRVSSNPDVADPASEAQILRQNQPDKNHNGGLLLFGPDDSLYIGLGDGGGGGDTYGNAQNNRSLLGKLLRIEVSATGPSYTVPADNPFVGDDSYRPEIWATGLRNPWRFAFDEMTGDLYIADVGQGGYEEVNFTAETSNGGENYGWNCAEAAFPFGDDPCHEDPAYQLPVTWYDQSAGDCSVTGGLVYRSPVEGQAPVYLYGDFCSGKVRGLKRADDEWETTLLLDTPYRITSFGKDEAGNIYFVQFNGDDSAGEVYRIGEFTEQVNFPLVLGGESGEPEDSAEGSAENSVGNN